MMFAAPETDTLEMAGRIAVGHFGEAERRWLQRGFSAWLAGRGAVSADACLRLPTTAAQVQFAVRDRALVAAAREIVASGPWAGARALAEELDRYATRGGWLTWRDLAAPPPGCSQLRIELHRALRCNDGQCLSAKQLHRIVGHIWAQKCLCDSSTLTSRNEAARSNP